MRHNGPKITAPRAACWLCDEAPAPSTPEAVEQGCTCPDHLNGVDHLGIEWNTERTVWAVASDCPLHARGLLHSLNRANELYPPEASA